MKATFLYINRQYGKIRQKTMDGLLDLKTIQDRRKL